MPAGIGFSGGFANFLAKDISKTFFMEYPRRIGEHSKVIHFGTADGSFIKKANASPLGAMMDRSEGDTLSYQMIKQGNTKTVTFTNFALAAMVTRNFYNDDRTGIIKTLPQQLAKAAQYTKELKAWDLFNNAFVTTYYTGLDSLALCYTAHTLLDSSSTLANSTTAAALSETSLQAALDTFDALTDDKGVPIEIIPKRLIIPYNLRPTAERLLKTDLRPGYADNDINVLKGKLEVVVSHYLTSSTAWFIQADEHDLNFIWREQIAMGAEDDFDTDGAKFKITGRAAQCFWNWQGMFGNSGA